MINKEKWTKLSHFQMYILNICLKSSVLWFLRHEKIKDESKTII